MSCEHSGQGTGIGCSFGGECSELAPVGEAELGEHVREMSLHGLDAHQQLSGNFAIGVTGSDELDHLPLRRGEAVPAGRRPSALAAGAQRVCDGLVQRQLRSGSTRLVILNPGNVYGPWGFAYTRLPLDLAAEGTFAFVENGEGLCHYNHVDNLVDAITASCLTTAAHGQRFIIADGRCTWREFLTPLLGEQATAIPSMSKAELAAQEPPPGRLVEVVRAALGSAEVRRAAGSVPMIRSLRNLARRVLPARPAVPRPAPAVQPSAAPAHKPVPAWLADLYPRISTRFTAAKAERVLGWRPQVTLAEGLAQGRAWWLESQPND